MAETRVLASKLEALVRGQAQPQRVEELARLFEALQAVFARDAANDDAPLTPPRSGGFSAREKAALRRGGFRLEPAAPTRSAYETLLDQSLGVEAAAARLEVTPGRIRQRLNVERTLFGIKQGAEWKLPLFQFDRNRTVTGIDAVLPRVIERGLRPVTVHRFFTSPQADLVSSEESAAPMTPLQWLREGHPPADVLALVEAL